MTQLPHYPMDFLIYLTSPKARSGSFQPRVVSALGCFGLGRFGLGRYGPVSFRPLLMGRFGLIFLIPLGYGE